jgi:peptidoglycan biosynthesis protein MviN/MurJ (putative lipid II flippase)
MSELYVAGEFRKVNEVFQSTIKFLLFILIPISGIIYLYSDQIVAVLFKRGSFDSNSVKLSSDFLRYLGLSIPFTAVISIAGNLYVAAQLIKISIGYQIMSNLLLIGLVYFFLREFGYTGYPIALFFVNVLNVLVVYIFCRLFFPFIRYELILKYIGLIVVINILIVFTLKTAGLVTAHSGAFIIVAAGSLIYAGILFGFNHFFHLNDDFNLFLNTMRGRITGRKL